MVCMNFLQIIIFNSKMSFFVVVVIVLVCVCVAWKVVPTNSQQCTSQYTYSNLHFSIKMCIDTIFRHQHERFGGSVWGQESMLLMAWYLTSDMTLLNIIWSYHFAISFLKRTRHLHCQSRLDRVSFEHDKIKSLMKQGLHQLKKLNGVWHDNENQRIPAPIQTLGECRKKWNGRKTCKFLGATRKEEPNPCGILSFRGYAQHQLGIIVRPTCLGRTSMKRLTKFGSANRREKKTEKASRHAINSSAYNARDIFFVHKSTPSFLCCSGQTAPWQFHSLGGPFIRMRTNIFFFLVVRFFVLSNIKFIPRTYFLFCMTHPICAKVK